STHEPQRHLHLSAGGLARLLAERPLVPLAFDGAGCADEVVWHLVGALADAGIHGMLAACSAIAPFRNGAIGADRANVLRQLGLPTGMVLDLPGLVERSLGEQGIDPGQAEVLSLVLDDALREATPKEEDQTLRRILRERPWLAEDGS